MSEAAFDDLACALCVQSWDMDLMEANALVPHLRTSLQATAAWAQAFGVTSGWFKTDYAVLAAPAHPPPPADELAKVIQTCRANGEASRYGATYIDLCLRWAWASDAIDVGGREPPYEGIKQILLAGAGVSGEHGTIGPGIAAIRIGMPKDHL